jgi:hypothetical protein
MHQIVLHEAGQATLSIHYYSQLDLFYLYIHKHVVAFSSSYITCNHNHNLLLQSNDVAFSSSLLSVATLL